MAVDLTLRILTALVFIGWWWYWRITEQQAYREKPKKADKEGFFTRMAFVRTLSGAAQLFVLSQLFGLSFLPIETASTSLLQLVGFCLVLVGLGIAIAARGVLGSNWSHAAEFQIKKKQELVTTGVYSFIRHPIYAGLLLAFIGGELVAQSYFVFMGVLIAVGAHHQVKQEETILLEHFGKEYKSYMKRTKRFIPLLW